MRLTEKFKDNYWDKMELNYNQENKGEIVDKLGQLEDIEEELGIDLIILLKALRNGVYSLTSLKRVVYCRIIRFNYATLTLDVGYHTYKYLKDYGKTWALTKEELL